MTAALQDAVLTGLSNQLAAVAQVVAVLEQVKSGLGRHILELSLPQLQTIERVS